MKQSLLFHTFLLLNTCVGFEGVATTVEGILWVFIFIQDPGKADLPFISVSVQLRIQTKPAALQVLKCQRGAHECWHLPALQWSPGKPPSVLNCIELHLNSPNRLYLMQIVDCGQNNSHWVKKTTTKDFPNSVFHFSSHASPSKSTDLIPNLEQTYLLILCSWF